MNHRPGLPAGLITLHCCWLLQLPTLALKLSSGPALSHGWGIVLSKRHSAARLLRAHVLCRRRAVLPLL